LREVLGGQIGGLPGGQVGLPGALPIAAVLAAQPASMPTCMSTPLHHAGREGPAAQCRRTGIGEELLYRRVVLLAEPLPVGAAQALLQRFRGPVAIGDDALVGDEDTVVRRGNIDLGAEF